MKRMPKARSKPGHIKVDRSLTKNAVLKTQKRVKRYRGKLKWEGDLDAMRRDD
ncbi:MAG TPA: hypothetical protein VEF03_01580 [Candidatus Binataceae bacterium]|nr:hypothetical protein [Candidatus Binataceae bacterium]